MRDGWIAVAVGSPELQVADCVYNGKKTLELMIRAEQAGAKVLVLPELGLTGSTCGDLFFQPTLLEGAVAALEDVLTNSRNMELVTVIGLPVAVGGKVYNCAAICQRGEILALVPKTYVSSKGELRHFAPAPRENTVVDFGDRQVLFGRKVLVACQNVPEFVLGVELGGDLWAPVPPSATMAAAGATVIANLSADWEGVGKADYRRQLVAGQSGKLMAAYLMANAGEGESSTDMVFGGHDLVAENGLIVAEQQYKNDFILTQIDVQKLLRERRANGICGADVEFDTVFFHWTVAETALTRPIPASPFVPEDPAKRQAVCREILHVTALGLKKRLAHTHAKTAVIGLSGGLDSTLALLITAQAFDLLGRDRKEILAVTMPCFGTTNRTRSNAELLAEAMGCSFRTVTIGETVKSHFADIGQSMECHDVTFENGQARERTQVLMDLANMTGGMVIGTGDLSELALGWATYNGDHMSMYGVNGSIPKTLVRYLVAETASQSTPELKQVLEDILDTPVSPELLPAVDGEISQKTEDLVGPYDLHDFFLYYLVRWSFPPKKIFRMACVALGDRFDRETILKWLKIFCRRFFSQQFKRSCLPDGPMVGSVTFSPRGGWQMPSDAVAALWLQELDRI